MAKQLTSSMVALLLMGALTYSQKAPDEIRTAPDDNSINLIYTPADGNIELDIGAFVRNLTTFEIRSKGSLFVGDNPSAFTGIFDLYTSDKSLKAVPDGFGDVAIFGNVGAGRTAADLQADFMIDGRFHPQGSVTDANIAIVVVPEPSWRLLALFVLIGFITALRKPN